MLPPYEDLQNNWKLTFKKYIKEFGVKRGSWQYVVGQFKAIIQDPKLLNRYASDRRVLGGDIARQDTTFAIAVLSGLEVITSIWSFIYYKDLSSYLLEFIWLPFLWILLGTVISCLCLAVVYLSSFDIKAASPNQRFRDVKNHWKELMWYGFDLHCNATVIPSIVLGIFQLLFIPLGTLENDGGWIGVIIGNTLVAIAIGYYTFILTIGISLLNEVGSNLLSALMIPGILYAILSTEWWCERLSSQYLEDTEYYYRGCSGIRIRERTLDNLNNHHLLMVLGMKEDR